MPADPRLPAPRSADDALVALAAVYDEASAILAAAEARCAARSLPADAMAAVIGLEDLLARSSALVDCLATSGERTRPERSALAARASELLARLQRYRDELRHGAEVLQAAHASVTALRSLAGSAAGERAAVCIDA